MDSRERDIDFCVDEIKSVRRMLCARGGLWRQRLAHACQCGAVYVLGSQYHGDTFVCLCDAVVFVPVRTAPSGGSAEDVTARHTQCFGIGITGMRQLRRALEYQESGPPVGV